MGKIKAMFNPKTIALVGATEEKGAVGAVIMENLFLSEDRKIFPVNPINESVMGLQCYPDIASTPEHVDLAVITTPSETVPSIIEECGKAGVEGLIIVSTGFKEAGEEGKKLEQQIINIRKKYGMRILGPNCIGILRPNIGLNASLLKTTPKPGNRCIDKFGR